ncbi:DUF6263 family protein [Pedobacter sp. B4-66]|uniref:DUF6263 family protein n=1 Tax=Pedobacter sp. B4-66 TaxID=2817280 RepID=UPI001BDA66B2|nr:DUF6263 family protein [Pedobacter sp. B4-66]
MKKILLLFLVVTGLLACKAKPENILIKLTKGQSYTQHTFSRISVAINMMGTEIPGISTFDAVQKFEVVDLKDSIYTLKVTYQSISNKVDYESKSTKMISNVDSSTLNNSPMMRVLDALKGKSYQIKMSNRGRVIETMGADSMLRDLITTMPGIPRESKPGMIFQALNSYGDRGIKSNAEILMCLYPKRPVRQGDSWDANRKGGNSLMEPKIEAVYTLNKITESAYEITGKSHVAMNSGDDMAEKVNIRIKLSGTKNSNSKIDKKSGLVTEIKIEQDIKGASVSTNKRNNEKFVIPHHNKGEIIITNTFIH